MGGLWWCRALFVTMAPPSLFCREFGLKEKPSEEANPDSPEGTKCTYPHSLHITEATRLHEFSCAPSFSRAHAVLLQGTESPRVVWHSCRSESRSGLRTCAVWSVLQEGGGGGGLLAEKAFFWLHLPWGKCRLGALPSSELRACENVLLSHHVRTQQGAGTCSPEESCHRNPARLAPDLRHGITLHARH